MNALRDGFRAVQDNLRSLAVYAVINMAFSMLLLIIRQNVDAAVFETPLGPFMLIVHGVAVLVGAGAQTVAFTWMGQRMGRPLWKISLQQGFHEFFGLWLFIQSIETVLWLICIAIAEVSDPNLGLSLLLAFLPVFVLTTPVGACVMYQGRASMPSFRNSFRILGDMMPQTLVLLMFSGLIFFLVISLGVSTVSWATPLVEVIGGYFDIVIFGAGWALCAQHENAHDDDDELDF